MNKVLIISLMVLLSVSCKDVKNSANRIAIAKAGNSVLYLDDIPNIIPQGTPAADSTVIIQNYINKWAKRELLLLKAEENISYQLKNEIDRQAAEARANFVIYQYQRQMMLEKMDTLLSDSDIETYYSANKESFKLNSNIVKALFIKLPAETPNIDRIKALARSNDQKDLQQLESVCFQFADKFDDFNEEWVPLNRISVELPEEIVNEENFLRRMTFYESYDSGFVYFLTLRDYRLRSSVAPYEYVRDDIKRIIWNNRRIEFIQSLENGIFSDAIKDNKFTIYK